MAIYSVPLLTLLVVKFVFFKLELNHAAFHRVDLSGLVLRIVYLRFCLGEGFSIISIHFIKYSWLLAKFQVYTRLATVFGQHRSIPFDIAKRY